MSRHPIIIDGEIVPEELISATLDPSKVPTNINFLMQGKFSATTPTDYRVVRYDVPRDRVAGYLPALSGDITQKVNKAVKQKGFGQEKVEGLSTVTNPAKHAKSLLNMQDEIIADVSGLEPRVLADGGKPLNMLSLERMLPNAIASGEIKTIEDFATAPGFGNYSVLNPRDFRSNPEAFEPAERAARQKAIDEYSDFFGIEQPVRPMVKEAGSDGFVPLEKTVGAPGTPGEVKPVLNPATKKGPSFDDVDYYFIDDYSPLESVLANSKDILGEGKKGFTGEQLLPRLKKAGVTDAEIDASGIGAFAASNKTVKRPASDYLDYVKENGADIKVIKLPRSQAEEFSQDGRPVDAGGEEFYHENFQRFMDRDAASEVDYVELVVSNPRTPDAASRDLTHHRGIKGAYAHVRYSDHKEPQVFGSQRISRVVEENQFDVVQQQYGKVPISEKTGNQFVTLTPQKISQLNNRIDELQDTADYKAFEGFRQERLGVDAKVADLKKRQLQYESETRSKENEFNKGINDGMSALNSISKDSLYSANRSMVEGQISAMAPNFIRNVVRDVVRQNSSKALMLNPDQLKQALQKGIDFPPDSPAFNNVVGTNTEQNLASRLRPDLDQLKNLPQGFNKVDHVALKISEAIKNNAEKSFDQGRAYYRKEAQNYPATAPGKITDVLETQNENSTTFLRGLFADLPDSRAIDFKSIVKEQEAVNVLRRENIASKAESDSLQEQALTLTRSMNEKRSKIFGSESDELVEYMYQDGFVGMPIRSTNIRFAPNQPFRNQKQAARHNIAMVVRDARQTGVDRIYFPDYRDMAGLRGQDPEAFKITYDAAPKSYIEELKKQFPDLETGKLSPDEFVENHLGETSAKYGGPEHPVTYLDLNFSGDGRLNSQANYRDNLLPR